MITTRAALSTTLAVLLLVFGGCGGGGGGGAQGGIDLPPQTYLQGDYAHVAIVRDTATNQVRCETGLAGANGQSAFSVSSAYAVSEGGTFGPLTPAAATYTEGANRSLSLDGLASVPLQGRVADDGSLAILSSRGPSSPATAILMRRALSPQVTDLAGMWTSLEWGRLPQPGRAWSSYVDLAVTGTGVLIEDMTTHSWNRDGQISPNQFVFPFQRLNVEADGSLTLRMQTGSVSRRGAVSADRNLILLGGDFTNPKLASIQILVRRNQAATTAVLVGNYHECNFESSILGYLSGYGDVTLDGGGGGTWSYSTNVEGIPFGPHPIGVGYGVGPNGTCGLWDTGSGVTWAGAVGDGGRYAFLTGGWSPNSNPLFLMLLR